MKAAAISISKAGKVRGQTPEVPKMEKPRAKTGRAALKQKYLKRLDLKWFELDGKVKLNMNMSTK